MLMWMMMMMFVIFMACFDDVYVVVHACIGVVWCCDDVVDGVVGVVGGVVMMSMMIMMFVMFMACFDDDYVDVDDDDDVCHVYGMF
jgi:hypothetical protein